MMKKIRKVWPLLAAICALGTVTILPAGCAGTPTTDSTGQYIDDSAITAKVKEKLIADDTVKARQIDVNTFKGVVQLSGYVDTPQQKDRAGQLAASVPGVRGVTNSIQVK